MDERKTVRIKANLSFEKVEIFLRAEGRLPNRDEDALTQEVLDKFCRKFEAGELEQGRYVSLFYLYGLIKNGIVKASEG